MYLVLQQGRSRPAATIFPMPEKVIPRSLLPAVGCRLNGPEVRAFYQLQKALGHEGHGAQAATVKEVLRAEMKRHGLLGGA